MLKGINKNILPAFLILASLIVGMVFIYLGLTQTPQVSNFQSGSNNITVIDLSKKKSNFNYNLALGIVLTTASLGFGIFNVVSQKLGATKAEIIPKLTPKELEIATLIKEGKSNKEIAGLLFISTSTVKSHVNSIYKKLEITSRAQLKELDL